MKNVKGVDEYISGFPKEVQEKLAKFRSVVHSVAPNAVETISYGIPTFKLNGKNLVHFGGFKDHISFFPTSSPRTVFGKELSKFKGGRGTIIFPLDQEIPWGLVERITKFRVKEVSKKKI